MKTTDAWSCSSLTLSDIRCAMSAIKPPILKRGDTVIVSLDDWAMNTKKCEEIRELCEQYDANMVWDESLEMGGLRIISLPNFKFEMPIEMRFNHDKPKKHWSNIDGLGIGYPMNITIDTV